jgi:hypothetical protein
VISATAVISAIIAARAAARLATAGWRRVPLVCWRCRRASREGPRLRIRRRAADNLFVSISGVGSTGALAAAQVQSEIAMAVLRQIVRQQEQQGEALIEMMEQSARAVSSGYVDTYA